MGLRASRGAIAELKKRIQTRYPDTEIKEGLGFEGGPKDVYVYAYAAEDIMDDIIEMSSQMILDILLKTGIYVHVIPLRPGTMTWLWDHRQKAKARQGPRAQSARRTSRTGARDIAESRAKYHTGKSAAGHRPIRKPLAKRGK